MKQRTRSITFGGLFLALALFLPFVTGQIPQIGKMLSPMHLPIMLCGFVCGGPMGLALGFIAPLLRSVLFGMPVLYPTALSMAFELAAYGFFCGLFWKLLCLVLGDIPALYGALVLAMLAGRAVWGISQVILLGIGHNGFTWAAFLSGAFINAVPAIVMQLLLVPPLTLALRRVGLGARV